jgi:hypothetical protein
MAVPGVAVWDYLQHRLMTVQMHASLAPVTEEHVIFTVRAMALLRTQQSSVTTARHKAPSVSAAAGMCASRRANRATPKVKADGCMHRQRAHNACNILHSVILIHRLGARCLPQLRDLQPGGLSGSGEMCAQALGDERAVCALVHSGKAALEAAAGARGRRLRLAGAGRCVGARGGATRGGQAVAA